MSVFLIGGSQRSGTTLLQTLLSNALPSAPLLPEAHILCRILATYQAAKTEREKTRDFYASPKDLIDFYNSIFVRYKADIEHRHGVFDHLVLKDPNFGKLFSEIHEILPDAKLILTVRDPRDIVASFIRIGMREAELGRGDSQYSKRNVDFFCKKANQSYENFLQHDEIEGSVIVVKYEDIVSRPQEELREIAKKSGVEIVLPDFSRLKWLGRTKRHKDSWVTPLEEKGPSAESVGQYRNVMKKHEISLVQRRCEKIMHRFHYEFDEIQGGSWIRRRTRFIRFFRGVLFGSRSQAR